METSEDRTRHLARERSQRLRDRDRERGVYHYKKKMPAELKAVIKPKLDAYFEQLLREYGG